MEHPPISCPKAHEQVGGCKQSSRLGADVNPRRDPSRNWGPEIPTPRQCRITTEVAWRHAPENGGRGFAGGPPGKARGCSRHRDPPREISWRLDLRYDPST